MRIAIKDLSHTYISEGSWWEQDYLRPEIDVTHLELVCAHEVTEEDHDNLFCANPDCEANTTPIMHVMEVADCE